MKESDYSKMRVLTKLDDAVIVLHGAFGHGIIDDDEPIKAAIATLADKRDALFKAVETTEDRDPKERTPACICPTECDCMNPEPERGTALVSNQCPIHNENPRPHPDCPAHE